MLKNNPNVDFQDEPHTLCSDLSTNGISIGRSSDITSLSLQSNPLQISQSPTRGFVTQEQHKSQSRVPAMQTFIMNSNLQNEESNCRSLPLDASELSHTASQTGSASNTIAEIKRMGKEMHTSENKGDAQVKEQEQEVSPPLEDPNIDPCLPRNSYTEPLYRTSSHNENNFSCSPFLNIDFKPPEFVTPSPTAFSETKFFSFVILHVPEDQDEAGRVCEILNKLEIGEGTTFCEGFETAGVSPLKCLEDAVENSAYIVLLLTTGFLSKWGEFQTNTVLMNSIEDANKSGTIIPFIPRFKTPVGKIPLTLKSLIPLNEKSHLFEKQVRNTFKRDIIRRQQGRWQREQHLRALKRNVEDAKEVSNAHAMQQHFTVDISTLLSNMLQQLIPGQVIQINNATNVQIGNQNSMNVQQTTNVPQTEYDQGCHRDFQS
ncbi:TIR domain-containing adapter molecule 1-like [Phyllobates terribilis]|uniref:TIR domain-containing adapter molecule 1-like n=1 Tax=Phyllobates terribilis TaxID=111132 RepID=UPI003CCB48CB